MGQYYIDRLEQYLRFVKKGSQLSFRAGAGIVYDSIPERELDETKHKAAGLIRAFNIQL